MTGHLTVTVLSPILTGILTAEVYLPKIVKRTWDVEVAVTTPTAESQVGHPTVEILGDLFVFQKCHLTGKERDQTLITAAEVPSEQIGVIAQLGLSKTHMIAAKEELDLRPFCKTGNPGKQMTC